MAISISPANSNPTPVGDPFEQACQAYPKLWPYLEKNRTRHTVNSQPMTVHQFAVWLLTGALSLR
jgi:hypothetical protein